MCKQLNKEKCGEGADYSENMECYRGERRPGRIETFVPIVITLALTCICGARTGKVGAIGTNGTSCIIEAAVQALAGNGIPERCVTFVVDTGANSAIIVFLGGIGLFWGWANRWTSITSLYGE